MVAVVSVTPKRSAISAATRFSGSNWACSRYTTKASIRAPYCTGAATPAGKAARVCAPHDPHVQTWARCSVTSKGWGGGRSNTCRAAKPLLAASSKTPPQSAHVCGKWSMVASAFSTWRRVLPGCPGCPPDFLPEGVRRLLIRRGFLSPSLDGGLPLLLLFRPRRRSSSAMRVCSVTMRSCCWVLRAINAAIMSDAAAAVPGDKAGAGWGSESEAEDMGSLTHVRSPESTGRARPPTWAVTTIVDNRSAGGLR